MWENLLDQMLHKTMRRGRIEVTLASGRVLAHGDPQSPPIRVQVTDPDFARKVIFNPDLAVAEAYMDGRLTIESDNLRGFLNLALEASEEPVIWFAKPLEYMHTALRRLTQYAPVGKAQKNVAHHYDLSAKLYRLFLDEDQQYSCAYFRTPEDSLELAQKQKKDHIARKLLLKPGMRVLDIGCGWGGMALTLARDYGANVVGVTLSKEQYAIAVQRAKDEGLENQVEFRLIDYRKLSESFDRIVSVGMFEHVGLPHYREYFRSVHDLLRPDGIALIHNIGRPGVPSYTGKFIDRYIFPGGYIPSLSEEMTAIQKEGLIACDVEVLRIHYAETLKHWDERFCANIDKVREIYDERFCRMWRFYLIGSEMSFRTGMFDVFQIQLSRKLNAVPLTRDYLYNPA